jgi:hypothetical protein
MDAAMTDTVIDHFLRRVRRRLWLETLLRQLRLVAWVSSGTLLLLALARLVVGAPRPGIAILGALGTGLVTLVPALLARPALSVCAQCADQRLGGFSLLTTAREVATVEPRGPVEDLVLAQGQTRTNEWQRELRMIWRAPDGAGFLVAIIPVFLALLVFEIASQREHAATVPESQLRTGGNPDAGTDIFGDDSVLPELRQAIRREPLSARGSTQSDGDMGAESSPTVSIAPPMDGQEVLEADTASTAAPDFAGDAENSGRDAGVARRRSQQESPSSDATRRQYPVFEGTGVSRTGGVIAGRASSDRQYAGQDDIPNPVLATPKPVPAPPPPSAWTILTATEVAYARQYLARMERPRD